MLERPKRLEMPERLAYFKTGRAEAIGKAFLAFPAFPAF